MTKEIPLTRGMVALVDDEDYEQLAAKKWYALNCGGKGTHFYARHAWMKGGKWHQVLMHRLIIDAPNGMHVDHINGNGLDNRRCNLRLATQAQNVRNTQAPRTITGFYGVRESLNRRGYRAYLPSDTERTELGWYRNAEDAARMYDAAAHLIGDEFHPRNFDNIDPASLEAVTNILNGAKPPREPKTLTDQDVIDIRNRYREGGVLMQEIADEYGVCNATINHAIGGRTFRHITDPAPIKTYKRRNAA